MRTAAGFPVLDEEIVRELAGFTGAAAPVTSCYLDVDGRRYVRAHDYEVHLDRMLRPVRERYAELAADPAGTAALLALGAEKAQAVAAATLARAKAAVGLLERA